MTSYTYTSSRPDHWTQPRPHRDASLRYMAHGPIQPMVRRDGAPGLIARLLGVG